MYWKGAVFLAPDGTLRRGRDEIRGHFAEVLPTQGEASAVEVAEQGEEQENRLPSLFLLTRGR